MFSSPLWKSAVSAPKAIPKPATAMPKPCALPTTCPLPPALEDFAPVFSWEENRSPEQEEADFFSLPVNAPQKYANGEKGELVPGWDLQDGIPLHLVYY